MLFFSKSTTFSSETSFSVDYKLTKVSSKTYFLEPKKLNVKKILELLD